MWDFLLGFALGVPLWLGVLVIATVIIYLNPEQGKKWGATLGWVISYCFRKADYISIKWEVEGRLNLFVKKLESNLVKSFPTVHLQWATTEDKEEVIWDEDRLILVMRDRQHKSRNFVHAAYLFTSETLLQNTSFHLSKTQKRSLELFATKKLLEEEYRGVVVQFMNDYFTPQVQRDTDTKALIAQFIAIERIGAFFPILIQEIHSLGNKIFLEEARKDETVAEVKKLIDFLVEFSEREIGDTTTPNTFVGDFTRCAIRVVASRAARERGETEGHKYEIISVVQRSIENIYVIGSGSKENRVFVDDVVAEVLQEQPSLQFRKAYRFNSRIKHRDGIRRNVSTYLVHIHNPEAEEYLFTKDRLEKEFEKTKLVRPVVLKK